MNEGAFPLLINRTYHRALRFSLSKAPLSFSPPSTEFLSSLSELVFFNPIIHWRWFILSSHRSDLYRPFIVSSLACLSPIFFLSIHLLTHLKFRAQTFKHSHKKNIVQKLHTSHSVKVSLHWYQCFSKYCTLSKWPYRIFFQRTVAVFCSSIFPPLSQVIIFLLLNLSPLFHFHKSLPMCACMCPDMYLSMHTWGGEHSVCLYAVVWHQTFHSAWH